MLVLWQWSMGAIEVLSLIIFIGFAVDYALHLAQKYMSCHVNKVDVKEGEECCEDSVSDDECDLQAEDNPNQDVIDTPLVSPPPSPSGGLLRGRRPSGVSRDSGSSSQNTGGFRRRSVSNISEQLERLRVLHHKTEKASASLVIGHWKTDAQRREEDYVSNVSLPPSHDASPQISIAASEDKHSRRAERVQRMKYALDHVGVAILGSAMTTIGCACFLLPCEIVVFHRIGAVVVGVTSYALCYTLVPLSAMLMTIGPCSRDHEYQWDCFLWILHNLSYWFARGVHPDTWLSDEADDADGTSMKTRAERVQEFVEAEEKMRKLARNAFDDAINLTRPKIQTPEDFEQRMAEMARRYVLHMPNRAMSARSVPEMDPQVVRTQIIASG
jgi:hypothetical protein